MYGSRKWRAHDRRHSHQHGPSGDQSRVPDADHGRRRVKASSTRGVERQFRVSIRVTERRSEPLEGGGHMFGERIQELIGQQLEDTTAPPKEMTADEVV